MQKAFLLFGLCLLFLGSAGLGGPLMSPEKAEAASRKKLTCSFIARKCVVGCRKEAPPVFCDGYCSGERDNCLRTGQWLGMRRTFRSVIRR
jgi:hypothetical protein